MPDLRHLVQLLEEKGKLYRFPFRINKDTELIPFYRVELRGLPDRDRKAILFEQVEGAHGNRYEMSVLAGCYGAADEILQAGLGCTSWTEALERYHAAYSHPLPPTIVQDAPVQEEVHQGNDLRHCGLDELPVPVEEVGYSGIIRTGLPMITRDPRTGTCNVGTYNGFFYDRDRMVAGIALPRDTMQEHWRAARTRGENLPIAIVVGPSLELMVASSSQIPYGQEGLDELTLAGGLQGCPVELVRGKTIPLDVPADAEVVIEGWLSTEEMEPSFSFGEYPGYMRTEVNVYPVVHVTAITHRRHALFTPITVGFYPSDSNTIINFARSALVYRHLRHVQGLPVEEVYFPQEGGGVAICVIRMAEGARQQEVEAALASAPEVTHFKYAIAVDHDIDVRDPGLLLWAISWSTRPLADISTSTRGGGGVLDPSVIPTGASAGAMTSAQGLRDGMMTINATRKWAYPPVGLPKREYMERAAQLWNECDGLPAVQMAAPWHGYSLGHWTAELDEVADLIAQGEYRQVGERAAQRRVPATDAMIDAAAAHRPPPP